MSSTNEPTIAGVLQTLAKQYNGIVSEAELFQRVLELRPSTAKNPYASIRNKIRWDAAYVGWVRLGAGEVVPLHIVLENLCFRVIPEQREIDAGELDFIRLIPFVNIHHGTPQFKDTQGQTIAPITMTPGRYNGMTFSLGAWYQQVKWQAGDSLLITIEQTEPLILCLAHEPKHAFRAQDVHHQEQMLLESIAQQTQRQPARMLIPDETILPIYARAEWRTAYPGRPWQMLVNQDLRLRLLDDMFIADSSFRRPLDVLFSIQNEGRHEEDQVLLKDIADFQSEMLASRRDHAEQGLWDGQLARVSTARVIFDMQDHTSTVVYLEPVDGLCDHSTTIESNIAQGYYASHEWQDQFFPEEDDAFDMDDDESFDDEFFGLAEINDIETFMEEYPGLAEAARKLLEAITPEELERLQQEDDPQSAQIILAQRLQNMLPSDPSLFSTFAVYTADVESIERENTNTSDEGSNIIGAAIDQMLNMDLDLDEESYEDDDLDAEEFVHGDPELVQAAMERSSDLMERFYQHLRTQGKSENTAINRTGDLWVYADFLASYYGRSLPEGSYATLDECLFFFYPRKVINSSPRAAREMCTSIKQFYAFMQSSGLSNDDFAQAIWRRRDQAARVVELYEHIDIDSPEFDRLFAHLFAPYTV